VFELVVPTATRAGAAGGVPSAGKRDNMAQRSTLMISDHGRAELLRLTQDQQIGPGSCHCWGDELRPGLENG
jgi:hypothetical protein